MTDEETAYMAEKIYDWLYEPSTQDLFLNLGMLEKLRSGRPDEIFSLEVVEVDYLRFMLYEGYIQVQEGDTMMDVLRRYVSVLHIKPGTFLGFPGYACSRSDVLIDCVKARLSSDFDPAQTEFPELEIFVERDGLGDRKIFAVGGDDRFTRFIPLQKLGEMV